MMRKSPIATTIEAACGHRQKRYDNHIAAYINRHYSRIRGRSCGKTYQACQQHLIQQVLRISAGATLRFRSAGRPSQPMQRIFGYDSGDGEEQAATCAFRRDPITGALTLMSMDIVERKTGDRRVMHIDEWPWFYE
ncbi:hypothetical protein [Serratia sp. BIGb0163]|uniref:hypothetical protein n=1 Tax=Serratia sp. BIGb0163 TaxID=2940613 RepID=UPI00216A0BF1|nr:hypothetical protein [Serratia sp. BIGb0163]MCS4266620.1 hypothetical protein [Serratia sp. BIGb0163]